MSLALSACFLVYASADRWTSSSSNIHIRSFSRIRIAQRMVFYTILIGCILYGQAFYCYASIPNQFPANCYCPNMICRIFNDLLFLILFSIIPPILMLGFGLITIRNVKKVRQLISPGLIINNVYQHSLKRKDRQMITMLFIQVTLFSICVLPSGISKVYSTLTFNQNKDLLEIAKENFLFQVKKPFKFNLIDIFSFRYPCLSYTSTVVVHSIFIH
jgi:hypothetical protein